MNTRRKWTWGGVLTAAASIATILSFLATSGSSSSSSAPPPATTVSTAYPAAIQANYLNACEQNGSTASCECTLNWFQQNVSLAQFEADDQQAQQGIQPADLTRAVQACSALGENP